MKTLMSKNHFTFTINRFNHLVFPLRVKVLIVFQGIVCANQYDFRESHPNQCWQQDVQNDSWATKQRLQ